MDVGTEKPATQTLVMKASIEKPGPRPHDVVSTHSAPAIEEGHITKLSDEAPNDIGWDAYQAALLMDPAEREAIAKRVKLKIDFILLPLMCFIYLVSFLDKTSLNYANAYGLQRDLGLHGTNYSAVAAITNVGYAVFAYPMTLALQKFPIGKFIATGLMIWGGLLMCTAAVHNFAGLMVLRFLLGGTESCIAPAWMLLTGMFWTRVEQPFRMSWWLGCDGIAVLMGAGISWGLGHTDSAIASWKLIFVVIGTVSVSLGILSLFILPNSPSQCVWLTPNEKIVAVWRVAGNQIGVKNEKIRVYQVREATKDIRIYFFAMLSLMIGVLNGSVTNFLSALLAGFGYGSEKVLLYQLPGGAFALICTLFGGLLNSYVPGILCLTSILALLPGLAGMIGIATISLDHRLALTACAWLQNVFVLAIILNWTLVTTNIAGNTKRATVNGVLFVSFGCGNIIGPFLFLPAEKPRYLTAIKTLAGMYGGCILMVSCLYITMKMENRKRDKLDRRDGVMLLEGEGTEEGFADMTDKENRAFRYKL